MKPATKARQALLASIIAGTTVISTGCSTGGYSLASMNPFAKKSPTTEPGAVDVTNSIASNSNSVGSTAKNALQKTTSAVAGVFSPKKPDASVPAVNDPLSLANKPDKVGAEVFVANGQLWQSTGDFGKAMESYTKALESEPNYAPALTSIARLHFRQGNHKLAADFFGRAIAQNANDAGLHNDLGLTLSKLGDHASAIKSLEKALTIAPGTSRYANNLASVQFDAGNAEAAYRVLSLNNKPAVAHFNMAYLHFKGGQLTDARGHLNQALQSDDAASSDAAVERAVERSRDMLAKIDATMAPIAQAAPQATVAAGSYYGVPAQVQQTSQSGTPKAGVSPAGTMAPAMNAITAPKMSTPAPMAAPTANTPSAPTMPAPAPKMPAAAPTMPAAAPTMPAAAPTMPAPAPKMPEVAPTAPAADSTPEATPAPKWGTSNSTSTATPTRPTPVKPAETTSESESSSPSIPFAMPTGIDAQ